MIKEMGSFKLPYPIVLQIHIPNLKVLCLIRYHQLTLTYPTHWNQEASKMEELFSQIISKVMLLMIFVVRIDKIRLLWNI